MTPTRKDPPPRGERGARDSGHAPHRRPDGGACAGPPLRHRSVLEVNGLDRLLEECLPSFGGGYLRRVWHLLDEAIGRGVPMTLSVAGPVTASGQHIAWLNPLLDTGWFCVVSTTDAVCYHDGHRSLDEAGPQPFHEVPIFGDDGALRDESVIRITDIGFDEKILLDQDDFIARCLAQPEFQERMSGTVMRHRLGRHYAEQERHVGAPEGLLALCHRKGIPIFVGAPADGSVFLNSMKLWARQRLGGARHRLELDLHEEVYESCAYHLWGLTESALGGLGTLILGGGVPKNFNLQPEPGLSQVLGLEDIRGYLYDIQITTAPVTDGSLSSCPPAEAVTWGKVDREAYSQTCESLSADYSIVMPILARALLEKRARLERLAEELGRETLEERHPEAAGYLRPREGYRLFDRRNELMQALDRRLAAEQTERSTDSMDPQAPASTPPGER